MHGHLDVVPADATEWSVPPFSGEEKDGYLWGRGAIDMKDFDAMVLAVVRAVAAHRRTSRRATSCSRSPPTRRPACEYGSQFLVREHADLLEGCTEAIGEVGGFSYTVNDDLRLYLVETAEKGIDWLRLHARGRPGHGSFVHDDNAVTALAEAVAAGRPAPVPDGGDPDRARRSSSRSPTRSASSSTRTTRSWPSPSSARSPT